MPAPQLMVMNSVIDHQDLCGVKIIIKFSLFHVHLFDSKNTLLYAYLLKEVLGLLMSVYQDFFLVNDIKIM